MANTAKQAIKRTEALASKRAQEQAQAEQAYADLLAHEQALDERIAALTDERKNVREARKAAAALAGIKRGGGGKRADAAASTGKLVSECPEAYATHEVLATAWSAGAKKPDVPCPYVGAKGGHTLEARQQAYADGQAWKLSQA